MSVVLAGLPAFAQLQAPVASAGSPTDADLDALLRSHNWNGLGAALSQPRTPESSERVMDWMRTRIDSGAGMLVVLVYARDLWALGNNLKIDDPQKDRRVDASIMSLYAYEIIAIDGVKCDDPTAPSHRMDQLIMSRAATFAFLKSLPADLKNKIVDRAISLEKKTAPLRQDDDLICRGGMQQMQAGIERGVQHPVPNAPGQYGKTIAVEPPPDWSPKFVAPDTYRPAQQAARAQMRKALLVFAR